MYKSRGISIPRTIFYLAAMLPVAGMAFGQANPFLDRARSTAAPPPPPASGTSAAGSSPPPPPAASGEFNQRRPGGALPRIGRAKKRVLAGTRVLDAISGDLLDEPRIIYLNEAELGDYFDDGTHGDQTKDDQEYANIETRSDFIGPRNQRLKEQTMKAILTAEGMDPIEFYGYNILTTDRTDRPARGSRWTFAKDSDGRPGKKLVQVTDDGAPKMERYQDKLEERDAKIQEWAVAFLNEYRVTKGEIESEFYQVYIPKPPAPPSMAPPTDAGWSPFPNPAGPAPEDLGVPGQDGSIPGIPSIQTPGNIPSGYYDEEMINDFLNKRR